MSALGGQSRLGMLSVSSSDSGSEQSSENDIGPLRIISSGHKCVGQEQGMTLQRRTLLKAGVMGLAWTAMRGLAAASNSPTRFVFHVSSTPFGLLDWLRDR